MIIKLYPYDYSKETPDSQYNKVTEEHKEFMIADSTGDLKSMAEEAFDLIQALIGYLTVMGVDIEIANMQHLNKLIKRHGGVK